MHVSDIQVKYMHKMFILIVKSLSYDLFLRIYDPKTGNYLLFMLELHLYINFMHEKVWTYFFFGPK